MVSHPQTSFSNVLIQLWVSKLSISFDFDFIMRPKQYIINIDPAYIYRDGKPDNTITLLLYSCAPDFILTSISIYLPFPT